MLAVIASGAVFGVDATPVLVEVDLAQGLPQVAVVGLPDVAVSEAKDRVRAAVRNAGYEWPLSRITVNLAPADTRKEGPLYDLPIAVGLLVASGQLKPQALGRFVVVGELALDGAVRPVRGVLPIAMAARAAGLTGALVPAANAPEAALVEGLDVYPVESLAEAASVLAAPEGHMPLRAAGVAALPPGFGPDFADVRGQAHAKRALEIAAAGGHNVCFVGVPGTGKTMLAQRLPGILPPLAYAEAVELTKIYSVAGLLPTRGGLVGTRPFRAPHHSISGAGLIGGGSNPRPGEISLAHTGVIFLDELAEFRRDTIDLLRQPMEEGRITIARAAGSATFPANITLVAAMNPCPCGYHGDPVRACICSRAQVERYMGRVSGPLLDRIDLHVPVGRLGEDELMGTDPAEPSAAVRARVVAARAVQARRFGGAGGGAGDGSTSNARMQTRALREHCGLDAEGRALMRQAIARLALSGRAYDRVLKLARTIADLADAPAIGVGHLAEALQYRGRDAAGEKAAPAMGA